jgi:hypothetical protein
MTAEMSDSAKTELRALIVSKLLTAGSIVSLNPRYYTGWEDYEDTYHIQDKCSVEIPPETKLEENYVHEFMGTFYEGDTNVAVVEMKGISCHCGRVTDRTLRWKGTVGEFIFTLLNDL